MKIKCDAQRLRKATSIIGKGNGSHVSPTQHMFLEASDIAVAKGSAESKIVCNLKAEIEERGEVLIPILQLHRFLRRDMGMVTISAVEKPDKYIVTLSEQNNGDSKMVFSRLRTDESFPIPRCDMDAIQLDKKFTENLAKVLTTASPDKTRPILNGVLAKFEGQKLYLVSSDGFRLTRIQMPTDTDAERSFTIPTKSARLISKYLGSKVGIRFNGEEVWFEEDGVSIIVPPIKGEFPEFTSKIPSPKYAWRFTVSASLLKERLSQFQPDSEITRIMVKDQSLKILMESDEDGTFETTIPAKIEKGELKLETRRIAVNRTYLQEYAEMFEEITCEIRDELSQIRIHGKPENILGILMPMFVPW